MPSSIEETLPEGFTKFDADKHESTVFDYEAIANDDDKELWLIRVPEEISEQNLTSMQIKVSKTAGKPLSRLQLDEKDMYCMYRVPEGKTLDSDVGVSGQEMLGLSCMVPSQDQKGKLVFAPKEISNYFILDEEVTIPDGTQLAESIRDKPVVKRQHPEGLQMRFKPYGFDTCAPTDVDLDDIHTTTLSTTPKKTKKDDDDSHTDKKRKKDVDDEATNEDKKKKKEKKKKEKKEKK